MSIITISLTPIGPYFISGIPRQVELSTNVPSLIFYTLDGSEPTAFSNVYTGPINMPTDVSVILKVFALSGADVGYLEVNFSSDISKLSFPWRTETGTLGIAIDAYNITPVLIDGYGSNSIGNVIVPVRRSDYELKDLEIQYSSTGYDGYGPGTLIRLGPFPESFYQDDATSELPSSPDNQNIFFNPLSLYITIDVRDGYDNEAVYPVMRAWAGTLDVVKYYNGNTLVQNNPYISGGLVRYFVNRKTGDIVFYYWDHNNTRWIKTINKVDVNEFPRGIAQQNLRFPLVFAWTWNRYTILD